MTHEPIVIGYPGTQFTPAEVTVTCDHPDCDWDFFSQESIGGGVEAWGDAWDEHIEEIERKEEV